MEFTLLVNINFFAITFLHLHRCGNFSLGFQIPLGDVFKLHVLSVAVAVGLLDQR